jgi:hypothetical protein
MVNDLVMRNIERTLQMAFFKFFGRADINPNAFCFCRLCRAFFNLRHRGCGSGQRSGNSGGKKYGGQQFLHGSISY